MKSALCCFLLFTAGLCAQSTGRLNSDLMAMARGVPGRDALARQIANDIFLMATREAQPSRQTVVDFANELIKAIVEVPAGESLAAEKFEPVTQAILDVLHSSGITSYRFHQAIDRVRDALIALKATAAQANSAAGRLLILGQEVRGPEDIGFQ